MNTLATKKLLGVAVSAALGMAGNAQAASYAVAYDNIFNWSITDSGGAALVPTTSLYDSESHAELGAGITVDDNNGASPPQSSFALLGGAGLGITDNNFAFVGPNSPDYGRGDGDIPTGSQSQKIGEAYVGSDGQTAGGGSVNTLDLTFTVAAGTTEALTFMFEAQKYLEAWTTGSTVLDFAEADNNFNITITDATGASVFDWSPDGAAGGITGGVETADAFDLSLDFFASSGNPGPLVYNQLGGGLFQATTGLLAAGTYSLGVSNETHSHVSTGSVPEPATLLLLGARSGRFGLHPPSA